MNQDNNFMDSRTLWAIFMVGIVWFGWQQYINKKYGDQKTPTKVEGEVKTPTAGNAPSAPMAESPEKNIIENRPENFVVFSNEKLRTQISSKGMALKNVELTQFKDRDNKLIYFSGGEKGLFSTSIENKVIDFQISKESEYTYLGVAQFKGVKINKKMTFTNGYNVNIETHFESPDGHIPAIHMALEEEHKKHDAGSIFVPSLETQEVFVLGKEGEKDFNLANETDGISTTIPQALLASINGHYFSAAFLDKSDIIPDFSLEHKNTDSIVKGNIAYNVTIDQKNVLLKGIGFVGPKDISVLDDVDPLLLKVVKFGFFSALAKPLLITMKWFYNLVGNWGWSIILLTLLVRMIVMPLHIMSFRSMKAMQKVQPFIQKLRDRYKDDPMTLNREMMALMKKHKVNPMGGCLPMLLQIPVFFALYRVFSESIELYRAPFVFWIHDLSMKDPYFVLPVLMAAAMYLQQKMTPSTMDPAQAKIMQFMPLIFSLMMVSLPSALTLYMFVSTFFGILQQYLFLKDKNSTVLAQ